MGLLEDHIESRVNMGERLHFLETVYNYHQKEDKTCMLSRNKFDWLYRDVKKKTNNKKKKTS
jgi:hypothetical protein